MKYYKLTLIFDHCLTSISKCTHQTLRNFLINARQNVEALSSFVSKDQLGDLLLLYLLENKLDYNSRRSFEQQRDIT